MEELIIGMNLQVEILKNFGLKRQNLIGLSPAVSGAEGVELSAVVEAKKCQYM